MKLKLSFPTGSIVLLAAISAHAAESWEPNAKAKLIRCESNPEYPLDAVRANATGTVLLTLEIDREGKVTNTWVLRVPGRTAEHRSLTTATLLWARTCVFEKSEDSDLRRIGFEYRWKIEP